MTCDRCEFALLCFGGVVSVDEVKVCCKCDRAMLNHGNIVFRCANRPQLEAALHASQDYTTNYPQHLCPDCAVRLEVHRGHTQAPTYYFDLDDQDMHQTGRPLRGPR